MPQRDPIRSLGDLIIDVEAGDNGPYQEYSERKGTPYQIGKNGDFVIRTGEVERLRINSSGVISGAGAFSLGLFNVKDPIYGAKGDGTTDDTAAILAAEAAQAASPGSLVFVPVGSYKTTIVPTTLRGPFRGQGQIIDNAGNKRGNWFSAINSAPSSLGNWGSVTTAFNGDLSKAQIAMEHRVTGATTLSQPATGYYQGHEEGPHLLYLYNESGWNQQTGSSDGRTGLAAFTVYTYQAGQGDLEAFYGNSFVAGAKAGATSFLANPAGAIFVGQVQAGNAGVYLNPFELHLIDGGFDVAGIGAVYNLQRTVNTGALDVLWNGVRVASKGTVPIDVGFLVDGATGGTQVGLDLSNAGLQTAGTWINAAITLSQNQRIYFQASGTDAGSSIYRRPSSTGTTYVSYDSGLSAISFVVGNSPALQLKSNLVTTAQNLNIASGKVLEVNNTQVVTARQTGWTACTGTPLRSGWATGSATLVQVAETVKALIDDLLAHGLIGA